MIEGIKVKQTSATTGTGDLTLDAAETGFNAFSDVMTLKPTGFESDPEFAPYFAETADGSQWEFGCAQVLDDTLNGALHRTGVGAVVFKSSNADALVNFSAGTTVRLITPINIPSLERGCILTGASGFTLSDQAWIDWNNEVSDPDDCWDAVLNDGPEFIYIPLWASEVMIYWDIEYFGTVTTEYPLGVFVDAPGAESIWVQGIMQNDTNWLTYLTGQARIKTDGSLISGNPINNFDRNVIRLRITNRDGIAVTSSTTMRLRMQILR